MHFWKRHPQLSFSTTANVPVVKLVTEIGKSVWTFNGSYLRSLSSIMSKQGRIHQPKSRAGGQERRKSKVSPSGL